MRGIVLLAMVVLVGSAHGDEWALVWSDEFAVDGRPDPKKWGYEEGFNRNREARYYTPKNARVERGVLVIEARKEHLDLPPARGGRVRTRAEYTSASLTTRRKAAWTYGKVEVRAKLPIGRGTWPAIWLLGQDIDRAGWPKCGEIDGDRELEPLDLGLELATAAVVGGAGRVVPLSPAVVGGLADAQLAADVRDGQPLGQLAVGVLEHAGDPVGGPSLLHGPLLGPV